MEKARILVVEDHEEMRKYLLSILAKNFDVKTCDNVLTGVELAIRDQPDLILLDVVMPKVDGFDGLQLLKNNPETRSIPVLFLSGKSATEYIVKGLKLGADDYIIKPVMPAELIARIEARVRKQNILRDGTKISHGNLKLILNGRSAFFSDRPLQLTDAEFQILWILLENVGTPVPRESRTVDVHIRRLREKIPAISHHIVSVYGVGYKYKT